MGKGSCGHSQLHNSQHGMETATWGIHNCLALIITMLVAKAMTQTSFCIDALKVDP